MVNRFSFNETSFFGWGAREVLIEEIKKRNFKKALVVTDDNLLKIGISNKVIDLLVANKIDFEIFSDVVPNPTISNVKKGLKLANKYHVDYIIAVGGGSVIDTAKAIGIICTNPKYKEVKNLAGKVQTKNKSLPVIALPTTAGTAAEVTMNYDITDEEEKVKLVCIDPNCVPILSIVDTEFMSGMPVSLAASTGMDAFTHAIECYINKNHNEMSDMYALKAINLIYNYLEKAINKDKDAMDKMAMAQYIAGLGFSNSGLGMVHSLSHQLSSTYNISDGVANALLLPHVLDLIGEDCADRFIDIAKAMGFDVEGKDGLTSLYLVIDAIKDLTTRLDIPQHFKDLGGLLEDIPVLAEKTLKDPCMVGNPRDVDVVEIEEIYRKAF